MFLMSLQDRLVATETYTMVESNAYFESYRHVLEGLKNINDQLPFQRYIVECEPEVNPPQYLLKGTPKIMPGRKPLYSIRLNSKMHTIKRNSVFSRTCAFSEESLFYKDHWFYQIYTKSNILWINREAKVKLQYNFFLKLCT